MYNIFLTVYLLMWKNFTNFVLNSEFSKYPEPIYEGTDIYLQHAT